MPAIFVVEKVMYSSVGSWWPATDEGLGAVSRLGVRRGQRLVPLHGISPLWVLYDLQAGPRGIFRRCDALRGIGF